jgi:hypothetical protein
MAATKQAPKESPQSEATRIIGSIEDAEHSALEAVRKFVDTVDGAFPALGDDAPRRKIIDSAFRMVEQLVGATNQLATNIVDVTEKAMAERTPDEEPSKK